MKRILIPLLTVLLLSGCAVYSPKTTDIPYLERQGDMQLSFGVDAATTGLYVSAAGAVTDFIGVQLSGNMGLPATPNDHIYSVRPAAGLFWNFPSHISLGAYGGMERTNSAYINGVLDWNEHYVNEYRNYTTTSGFLQLDFAWQPIHWFGLGLRYTQGKLFYDARITPDNGQAPTHLVGDTGFGEWALQLRFGGEKAQVALGATLLEGASMPSELYCRPLTFGLGFTYRFNPF